VLRGFRAVEGEAGVFSAEISRVRPRPCRPRARGDRGSYGGRRSVPPRGKP